MSKTIHIVSFDIPFPADYGGIIDVFSRVKWFSENGWKVILHCFEYKKPQSKELEKYAEVYYYKRPLGIKYWLSKLPYIVNTRINSELEKVLKETKDEVLLEGLHCSYYLNLQPGKFYLRAHNIEHEYYSKLAEKASFLKKIFYTSEARKLKRYESIVKQAKGILVISEADMTHFSELNANCHFTPPIIDLTKKQSSTEQVILFQGKLSVEENEEAVNWILETIAPSLKNTQIVIAGKNPSTNLIKKCAETRVELIVNPSEEKMNELIDTARVHLLWTKNSAGVKIKFLKAMSSSGHVVCTEEMALGTGLKGGYHLITSKEQTLKKLAELLISELSVESWKERQNMLNTISGVQKLKELFA
jgi:hypothetical protein